jgi:UDP-N-acetylmuramoyl-L-alanyl-D-glutamate--2,6-diaminopimelate ligase
MQLRELIAEMNVLAVHGSTAVDVTGISYEARRVVAGDIYVALQREASDGHAEIELAVSRGAVAVLCRPATTLRSRVTRVEVPETRTALAELSSTFYGRAGEKLHVIGITGGKSAWKTAHLTKQLLLSAGVKAGLISSLRHEIGDRTLPSSHFPESSDMQRLFAGMVRDGCTACVLELPTISPTALRNIPVNVLLYQGGEQNLRALSLFVNNHSRAPVCGIINLDSESGRALAQSNVFKMHLGYALDTVAEVGASELSCNKVSSRFVINLAGHTAACEVPMIGKNNVRHLLGAAAASLSCLTPRQVLSALAHVRTAPASLEFVPNVHGLNIYIDHASDSESLTAVLSELRDLQPGRILLSFGSPEKCSGKDRFDLGRAAARFADHIILTSDNPGNENQEAISFAVAQGIEDAGRARYHLQSDRAQAIRELIAMAEPGDVVLITGKGEKTLQIVGDTAVPFSDREVATDILQNVVRTGSRIERGTALAAA